MIQIPEPLASALSDRYRIDGKLGAGGMAAVFQARDLKHDRDVAIKVLHPELGAALGSERFLSEIRTTAQLQHPHILTLLDSGSAEGLLYYVMPLARGETLRGRLEREKQLPVEDALRIAREVADALDYAHSFGIIHRDIKPENILLHGTHALVADFGIALAVQSAASERMTQTGLSLGTPQYMSPEQAMGERHVDARSDVYALGAVTYEMLTGTPPFTGATVQAIVAKVITERAAPVRTVRETVPPHVEHAVLKALSKLPADRWPSAREFSTAISHPQDSLSLATPAVARRSSGSRRMLLLAGALLIVATLGAAAWSPAGRAFAPAIAQVPLSLDVPGASPDLSRFAISPNGSVFAFATDEGLVVRDSAQREYRVLPGTVNAESPSFSPDGRWIAYAANGVLQKVPVGGGAPITLIPNDSLLAGRVNWGADGTIVFETSGHLGMVLSSGAIRVLPKAVRAEQPRVTYDGKGIFYVNQQRGSKLMYYDLADDSSYSVVDNATEGQLLRSGHLVYGSTATGLYAVRFDQRRRRVSGQPIPAVLDISPNGGVSPFVVAGNGTLVYRAGINAEYRVLVREKNGQLDTLPIEPQVMSYAIFSPDGQRLALTIGENRGTNRHTAIYDFTRRTLTRFTQQGGGHAPVWSPDGTRIAYTMEGPETDAEDIVIERIDRSGEPVRMPRLPSDQHSTDWPNDSTLLFSSNAAPNSLGRNTRGGNTNIIDPRTGKGLRSYLQAQWGMVDGRVSPDGKWVAYTSYEGGEPEVHVRPFPDVRATYDVKVSAGGGQAPRWSPGGRSIFYRTNDQRSIREVELAAGMPLGIVARRTIMTFDRELGTGWDVSRSNGRLVLIEPVGDASASIVVIQNWLSSFVKRAG
jgi:eukaryotic-like serine/threonine-protein kinase